VASGVSATLQAWADTGWLFSHWEIDDVYAGFDNPKMITVNADTNVTAMFVRVCTLLVVVSPSDGGTVAATPPEGPYPANSPVTLTATPAAGYVFDHWEGNLIGSVSPATVVMTANKIILAVFIPRYALSVMVSPSGGGSVTLDPPQGPYRAGTAVSLTPVPSTGYKFDHWEGNLTGSTAPVSATMNADKDVTAVFVVAGCAVETVTAIAPVDGGVITLSSGATDLALMLSAATGCAKDTAEVTFTLDSDWQVRTTVAGGDGYYTVAGPTLAQLGLGQHSLVVKAASVVHPEAVIQDTIAFTLVAATADADRNNNGLPDDSFSVASQAGDSWVSSVDVADTGLKRYTVATRWDGCDHDVTTGAPIIVSAQSLSDPPMTVTVSAPQCLLQEGETGILIVQMAPDLVTLLGPIEASMIGDEPAVLVVGGQYVEIAVIVSLDSGQHFIEAEDARLVDNPVHVRIEGLDFAGAGQPALYEHPTSVVDDALAGDKVITWEGPWSKEGITNLKIDDTTMDADLLSLSLYAPYDEKLHGPKIAVTPPTQYRYVYGLVEVGGQKDATFTVKNQGAGTLIGTASTSAPFSIVSGGSYELGPGESRNVVVRFSPTEAQGYTGAIVFTGGGGATFPIVGTGYNPGAMACPGGTLENPLSAGTIHGAKGDMLLAALVMTALLSMGRIRTRTHADG
jgi:hypothetical protein